MEFISEKSGERLDKFLAVHLPKFSRTRFQELIKTGDVKVNDKVILKSGLSLKTGDKVFIPEEKYSVDEKEFVVDPDPEIPLDIVYEDKDIVVLNKQPGLIVHPTPNYRHHTLANALVAHYPKIIGVGDPSTSSGQGSRLRPGIVHRLDKDTSGLMVIAKNQKAFLFLKNQFVGRTISKTYIALVEGIPEKKDGVIQFQIRPSTSNRLKKVAVKKLDKSGKKSVRAAETDYKLREAVGSDFSLIEEMPKTGRTHQIRVHLSAIGNPVVGDVMYGAKKTDAKRQMLHAYRLEFTSPKGRRLKLEAPMPQDMSDMIYKLSQSDSAGK